MAHADMAEGIDHALIGDDTVCKRKLAAGVEKRVGHWHFLLKVLKV
jgi:hypothetical protein